VIDLTSPSTTAAARVGERVLEWLADEGIDPVETIG
jgi:hypothetical protein